MTDSSLHPSLEQTATRSGCAPQPTRAFPSASGGWSGAVSTAALRAWRRTPIASTRDLPWAETTTASSHGMPRARQRDRERPDAVREARGSDRVRSPLRATAGPRRTLDLPMRAPPRELPAHRPWRLRRPRAKAAASSVIRISRTWRQEPESWTRSVPRSRQSRQANMCLLPPATVVALANAAVARSSSESRVSPSTPTTVTRAPRTLTGRSGTGEHLRAFEVNHHDLARDLSAGVLHAVLPCKLAQAAQRVGESGRERRSRQSAGRSRSLSPTGSPTRAPR